MKRTLLHAKHSLLKAKMTEFQGWQVPLQFTDPAEECHAVRTAAGLFDIGFLGKIEITGTGASALLQKFITRSLAKIPAGTCRYSLICSENGTILDDPVVFHLPDAAAGQRFLLTTSAPNADKIHGLLSQHASSGTRIADRTAEFSHLSLQGPRSFAVLEKMAGSEFKRHRAGTVTEHPLLETTVLVARTGYSGEHGYELIVPSAHAERAWNALVNAGSDLGLQPCGFACRDILRMESGFLLYGNDIDETRNPIEAGLEPLIDSKKEFTGKEAVGRIRTEGTKQKLIGFKLLDKGVPKTGGSIFSENHEIGVVTSGCQSPLVRSGIGLGYVITRYAQPGQEIEIEVRDREITAKIVELPFSRK